MRGLILVLVVAFTLAFAASASAAQATYAEGSYWPAGQGASSSFSSSWVINIFSKSTSFDATITFIDNVSYSWHSTLRSTSTYMRTHWFSSQTKKAHCRANATGSGFAGCTVYS
jgi:hypothetical protein